MNDNVRRLIKIVMSSKKDLRRPLSDGGSVKVFDAVTSEVRGTLDDQVGQVLHFFEPVFREIPALPAVARVVLKKQALAKSHRPTDLFNASTCPVIGAGSLGELYVRAQATGLHALSQRLRQLGTKKGIANISTIQEIKPYTAVDALERHDNHSDQHDQPAPGILKLRLFRHHENCLDQIIFQAFLAKVRALNLPKPEAINYAPNLSIFRLQVAPDDQAAIDALANFVGTQSLSVFPTYHIHQSAAQALQSLAEHAQ